MAKAMVKTHPASSSPGREVGESRLKAGGVRATCHPLATAHRPRAAAPHAGQAPARPRLPPARAPTPGAPLHHHPAAVPSPALGPQVHHGRYYLPSNGMASLGIGRHCSGARLGAAPRPERCQSPGARLRRGTRALPLVGRAPWQLAYVGAQPPEGWWGPCRATTWLSHQPSPPGSGRSPLCRRRASTVPWGQARRGDTPPPWRLPGGGRGREGAHAACPVVPSPKHCAVLIRPSPWPQLLALVGIRKGLERIFSPHDLSWLDTLLPGGAGREAEGKQPSGREQPESTGEEVGDAPAPRSSAAAPGGAGARGPSPAKAPPGPARAARWGCSGCGRGAGAGGAARPAPPRFSRSPG